MFLKEENHAKVINEIPEYGYTLEADQPEVYKNLFEKLAKVLSAEEVDEEEYARLVAQMLAIDFYNYYQHPGSFMMNYDERSCMYMLRAMESVERFRREYVEGEKMNYFFQNLIAKNLLKALKRSIQWGAPAKIQLQMITEMNKLGLTPLPKDKAIFYTWLYNISPALFLRYYRIKLKKVSR